MTSNNKDFILICLSEKTQNNLTVAIHKGHKQYDHSLIVCSAKHVWDSQSVPLWEYELDQGGPSTFTRNIPEYLKHERVS